MRSATLSALRGNRRRALRRQRTGAFNSLVGALGHDRHGHYPPACAKIGQLAARSKRFLRSRPVHRSRTKYAMFLIRVGCSRARQHSQAAGDNRVQAEDFQDSVRPGLVAMLPRLKRFADLLVGDRRSGTALLGRALNRMLAEQHRYQRGTPLDRWAFAEIYRHWLVELRESSRSRRPGQGRRCELRAAVPQCGGRSHRRLHRELPAQPAAAAAAHPAARLWRALRSHRYWPRALDVPSETVATRLVRISAGLADRLSAHGRAAPAPASKRFIRKARRHDRAQRRVAGRLCRRTARAQADASRWTRCSSRTISSPAVSWR